MATTTVNDLSEKQKIAVLLASLNEKVSASILQHLEPDIMTEVADSIRSLGVVSGDIRNQCISQCVQGILEMGNAVQGDEAIVNSLLKRAIGEKRANALLQEGSSLGHKAFSCLSDIPSDQITAILASEQPSIIAVVLRFISADVAGEIISALPTDLRKKATVFMCSSNPPSTEVVSRIETYMANKLVKETDKSQKIDDNDTTDILANIFQAVDRTVEEELLAAVEEHSEETSSKIRDKLFTFEDIIRISDADMRRILQEIDMGMLALSLRSASIALRDKFFNNMSKRAAEGIKEEMEFSQKVKLSDVETRQKEMINVIRGLESDGQIQISAGEGDEFV